MYRTCIFCSAPLGANEAVEAFPVGRSVAFDAQRGRLWAVCGRCARWNLAPLEERWEAVEAAERSFADARLRVQSENIGLARLPDGTRLIRVGDALTGELAAWRYGSQLVQRRRKYVVGSAVVIGAGLVVMGGLAAVTSLGGLGGMWGVFGQWWDTRRARKVIYRLRAGESPTGSELTIRRWHALGARLGSAAGGDGVQLHIPDAQREKR